MTESLDESHKLHKGLIFWVCNFHEFIFLGLIFPGIYFFGYQTIIFVKKESHRYKETDRNDSFPASL